MLGAIIKQAFENTVLCRGAHGPKESYEYAERMEKAVKERIVGHLKVILDNPKFAEENLKKLIEELES